MTQASRTAAEVSHSRIPYHSLSVDLSRTGGGKAIQECRAMDLQVL